MAGSAVLNKSMNNNQSEIFGDTNLKKNIEICSKRQSVDTKSKSIAPKLVKSEEKGKAIAPETPVKKATRQKKNYKLPGQKHDLPAEREPLRIFYESLSKQIPTSEMAEIWLMEHGILSSDKAKMAYEKKLRKQKQIRMGIPIKALSPYMPESSNRQKLASKNVDIKPKRNIVKDDEVIPIPKRRKA